MRRLVKVIVLGLLLMWPLEVQAISVSARNAVLMDLDSGRILYEKAKDDEHLVASITKIMTCVLAIESGKIDDIITVGEEVLAMYGSNIYLELGEKMKMKDMLYGLMMRSGNDAAIVLATYIAGSEEKFVKMMNAKAQEIGMKNTHYANSHGLDEKTQNYSTAYDMALLSKHAMTLPLYREIVGTKKYTVQSERKSYVWNNRNQLLFNYEYTTGGKTGYTPSAGKTLVTTASKDGLNLTIVTLNDGNQYQTHKELYEMAFENYKNYIILDKDNFKIDQNYYPNKVYIKNSFSYPLTEEEKDKVHVLVQLVRLKNYNNGDSIGNVKVYLNEQILHEEEVFVEVAPKKGFFDWLRSWFS